MMFHSNGDWGSIFYALGRLSTSLRLGLSLSLRLSLSLGPRGGLLLIPSRICAMEGPPKGRVNQFRLQHMVVEVTASDIAP